MNMIDNLRKLVEKNKVARHLPELEKISRTLFDLILNFTDFIKYNLSTEIGDIRHKISQLYKLDDLITNIIRNIASPIKPIQNPIIFNSTHSRLGGNLKCLNP